MLLSLALIFLSGMLAEAILQKLKLPSLLGMLLCGILLGPYALNLIDPVILDISASLRQIALIIILMRAGLNLDLAELKKVGRPAVMMCFVPACFEIAGMILLAPPLLGITVGEAAVMGAVVAAVSPAVIVPRMLKLMESGYGTEKSIPQMIMAGASVDDVFVIVLFTAFTGLVKDGSITPVRFVSIPTSIVLGLLAGIAAGFLLAALFRKVMLRDSKKVLLLLATAFAALTVEQKMTGVVGFSGLLAVMALGCALGMKNKELSVRLSAQFSKLWVGAEILLFVLVGASVNIEYGWKAGLTPVLLIFLVLLFRMAGVFICMLRTSLNKKERIFTAFAYLPKATVQAAIGGLPLAMGLACGDIVLTVAVLSICITAPLGAVLVDVSYRKLLVREKR